MRVKKRAVLALVVVVSLCRGNSLADRPRLDVRTMADWAIVVAESAIESEVYAAEEFRDKTPRRPRFMLTPSNTDDHS